MKKLLVSLAIGTSAVVMTSVGGSADVSVYAPVCPNVSIQVAGQPVTVTTCVPVSTTIATP